MKPTNLLTTLLTLTLPTTLALPTINTQTLTTRQTTTDPVAIATTDELLFTIPLPAFTQRRNERNPPDQDWESDGCSSSPDNPLNFPFEPACHRHDFGYRNYKAQGRFTAGNRLRIDDNFRRDLYYQCSGETARVACEALADVYYAAVRAFGGEGETPGRVVRAEDVLVREYEERLAVYNEVVAYM